MNPDNAYLMLAQAVARILAQPVTVTPDIEQFAESSFGIGSHLEMVDLLVQGDPDDRAQLLDLLIFPDETTQALLEPFLEALPPGEDHQHRLVTLLRTHAPRLNLRFPENERKFSVTLPSPTLEAYVSRLYPDRCLDQTTLAFINGSLPREESNGVKVAIRNHNLPANQAPWDLLRRFLGVMASARGDGLACLSRLLKMLEQTPVPGDYYPVLAKLKHLYAGELRRWEQFERQQTRLPMESLLLQGIHPPAMTREVLLNELAYIDQLCMLLYGKIGG
ncbi:MAG: hypothetical protein WBG37_01505 [Desulfobacterales bacterium]